MSGSHLLSKTTSNLVASQRRPFGVLAVVQGAPRSCDGLGGYRIQNSLRSRHSLGEPGRPESPSPLPLLQLDIGTVPVSPILSRTETTDLAAYYRSTYCKHHGRPCGATADPAEILALDTYLHAHTQGYARRHRLHRHSADRSMVTGIDRITVANALIRFL